MVGKTRLLVYLFCIKEGEQNFFFSFSYLSFFPCQYNLMHYRYYQLRTITIKLVCQTMMNEHHERRSACLISI